METNIVASLITLTLPIRALRNLTVLISLFYVLDFIEKLINIS